MCVFFSGCVTSQSGEVLTVLDNYKTVVFKDAIGLEEAKIIAQRQLVKKNVVDLYYLSRPQIEEDVSGLPGHQDYWFIYFEEKQSENIPFIFMVAVNKQDGRVKFADDYNEGNRWILEAALLR
jgi:hypothetical protein